MLSEERIEELWVSINKGKFMCAGFNTFARAIEAAVLAEKQEPVKDEPVTTWSGPGWNETKQLLAELDHLPVGTDLYTHPQPELTAEVEFMQGKYEEMLAEWLPRKQRIAELEEAAREAREALSSCGVSETDGSDYYNRHQVSEAIAKLDGVLCSRRKYGD